MVWGGQYTANISKSQCQLCQGAAPLSISTKKEPNKEKKKRHPTVVVKRPRGGRTVRKGILVSAVHFPMSKPDNNNCRTA